MVRKAFSLKLVSKNSSKTQMLFSYCIAGFFDYPYLEKEFIDILDFSHRNSHQRNDKSDINSFSWLWWAVLSHTQISWNFKKSVFRSYKGWNEMKNSLENQSFISYKKFQLLSSKWSLPIRLLGSFISNISWRNQRMYSIFFQTVITRRKDKFDNNVLSGCG